MQKLLIIIGVIFIIVGLLLPWIQRFGLGHLPGDFIFKRPHFTLYFPLTTCIILSLILAVILWLLHK